MTLTATTRGRTMLRRAPRPTTERLLEALGALAPVQARAISRGLGALLERLGAVAEEAPLLFESRG